MTEKLHLRCQIDILFLRPEGPQYIMQGGDLDARVKTIFDALRVPSDLSETGGVGPQDDEVPFFCLLSDDKLVTGVSVTCDELLLLPKERGVTPNDAFLMIHVQMKPAQRGSQIPLAYLFE